MLWLHSAARMIEDNLNVVPALSTVVITCSPGAQTHQNLKLRPLVSPMHPQHPPASKAGREYTQQLPCTIELGAA
jgi:hypothetical protein